MALDTERIVGHQVTDVKIGRYYTDWLEISIDVNEEASAAKGSDSNKSADVNTATGISGTLSVYMGSANNGATTPKVNDPIDFSDMIIAADGDPIVAELADYTDYAIVGPKQYRIVDGASTLALNFKSGRKNPNTA